MIELKLNSNYGNERMFVRASDNGNLEIEIHNYKDGNDIDTKYELDSDEIAQLKKVLTIL